MRAYRRWRRIRELGTFHAPVSAIEETRAGLARMAQLHSKNILEPRHWARDPITDAEIEERLATSTPVEVAEAVLQERRGPEGVEALDAYLDEQAA